VTAGPDVAGLLEALAALPDRTPAQRQAYALQLDTWKAGESSRQRGPQGDGETPDEEVLGRLAGLKLSKAARKVIEQEFTDYEISWT